MGSSCSNFVDSPSKEPKCQFVEKTEKPYGLVRASKFSNKSVKVWTKEAITTGSMILLSKETFTREVALFFR